MRINKVEKARKFAGTCKRCGARIEAGQPYKWIKGRYSPKRVYCGLHSPRPSEMTGSDKLSRLYEIQETIQDSAAEDLAGIDGLADVLDQAAADARDVGQEYRDSAANMESAFPSGNPTIDECNEKARAAEDWADELESAANDVREIHGQAGDLESQLEPADPDNPEDQEQAGDNQESADELISEANEAASQAAGALEI